MSEKQLTEADIKAASLLIEERDKAIKFYEILGSVSPLTMRLVWGGSRENNIDLPFYTHNYLRSAALERARDLNTSLGAEYGLRGVKGAK